MNIGTNRKMRELLSHDIGNLSWIICEIPESLKQALDEARFVDQKGLVTFEGSPEPTPQTTKDLTGAECLSNKWHIDEYLTDLTNSLREITIYGICFAIELQKQLLKTRINAPLRIIVSTGALTDHTLPTTCTVQLHRWRADNPWLDKDLESYETQAILTFDWNNNGELRSASSF